MRKTAGSRTAPAKLATPRRADLTTAIATKTKGFLLGVLRRRDRRRRWHDSGHT